MNKSKTWMLALAAIIAATAGAARAEPVAIVALGDSLTSGYGLAPGESFPEQLAVALKARGHDVTVVNAGVSGDTASDGLARVEWSVPAGADIVIVELGSNDALRGIDPGVTKEALAKILAALQARGQAVLLAGMLAPPNLGDAYATEFNAIFPALAAEYGVPLYPFFLDGVVTQPGLNQSDGMHPNAAGVTAIVKAMLPDVEALVAKAGGT